MPGTITVASKLPFPLGLQLQHKTERLEQTLSGEPRVVNGYVKDDRVVTLAGCAVDNGKPSTKSLVGGFVLTHGVDADFWAEWVRQHKGFAPLEKGLIFAVEKGGTESEAKSRAKVKSGFEPVDPDSPPEEFRGRVAKFQAA